MGTSTMRVMGVAAVMAVAVFGFAGLGLAGGPLDPRVKTVVTTTQDVDSSGVPKLLVEVELMQMLEGGASPVVPPGGVKLVLEQHWPNSVNPSGWVTVQGSERSPTVLPDCLDGCNLGSELGSRVDVADNDYNPLCTNIDAKANAIRAVAVVTVSNAQAGKPKNFLGRSVSIANPCKG